MSKPATPDAYFEQLAGAAAELASALRRRVMARGPDLTEQLAWGFPCFSGRTRIFSIIAHSAHVNLQLWSGARLTDEHPRIEGSGKALRHVKLRALSELDADLDRIIDAAITLDRVDPVTVR